MGREIPEARQNEPEPVRNETHERAHWIPIRVEPAGTGQVPVITNSNPLLRPITAGPELARHR